MAEKPGSGENLRSLWQKIRKLLSVLVIIAVCVFLIALIVLDIRLFGTGFAGKTLFDWLNLIGVLAIPVVVGVGAAWFTAQQGKVSERETRDNQRHATLQVYLDKMSELLLNGNLVERTADDQSTPEYKQGCLVARVRTITVLTQLDARRVGYVFAFLREAELMSVTKDVNAISLKNADLHAVDWSQADLRGADLRGVNLSGANLSGAIFSSITFVPRVFGGTIIIPNRADLRGADLSRANLRGADLNNVMLLEANLSEAILDGAKLSTAGRKYVPASLEKNRRASRSLEE